MWNRNRGIFDINFLVNLLRRKGNQIEYIQRYKEFIPQTSAIFQTIKTYNVNRYRVYDENAGMQNIMDFVL